MTAHRRTTLALVATAALIIPAAPAGAATVSDPLVDGLGLPLGIAVGSNGTLYVAHADFATETSTLSAVPRKGPVRTVRSGADVGGFIAGVDAKGRGTLTYTVSAEEAGQVRRIRPSGRDSNLGDVGAFEFTANPDQVNTYGFAGLDPTCEIPAELLDALMMPAPEYPGVVDSNPYAVAILPDGSRVMADAGGNSLVRVQDSAVTLLAVLPPVPMAITEEMAGAFGLPDCTIGTDFQLDPVPTDVEVGPDGMLYVSSLPGGPEDGSISGLGGVFRVDPWTGGVQRIASGFTGATDLAVMPDGTIYVTEFYIGAVSKVVGGSRQEVVSISGGQLAAPPVSIEQAKGLLYVGLADGSVVTIRP
jgi:hypothetical protein